MKAVDDNARLTPGGFIAQPEAFQEAPSGLSNALKLFYRPTVRDGAAALEFSTDAMLIDLSTADPDALDPDVVAADCDFVKEIVTDHPDEVRQLLKEMQRGTAAGVERAEKIVAEIGLTESNAVRAGGGLFWFVIIAVAAVGSAGCGGALKQKATSPAATTTPGTPK